MTASPLFAGIASLAVKLPERVVTNDELRDKYASTVAEIEKHVLGKLWAPEPNSSCATFDHASARFMSDPFRGCVERHWLKPGQPSLDIEVPAARLALERAKMTAKDVDAIICCSFFPDQFDVGNAAFLAKALGVTCPAWNVESACSGSTIALVNAASLVHAGVFERVLVVTSCNYSRICPADDTLSWGNGDAAAAFVVTRVDEPAGVLAFHAESTNITCGAIWSTFEEGNVRMHTGKYAGRLLRETAEPFLRACVDGALAKASLSVKDVDVFVCNTPTAWYVKFACDVLGIPEERTVNAHPRVANVGPALMPCNLELAAQRGLLRSGAVVLLYAIGSVSNATACVLRCGRALEA